jgi:hypothetical protein
MHPSAIYQQQITRLTGQIAVTKRRSSWLSWGRLAAFIVALFFGYGYFQQEMQLGWLPGVVLGLGGFIYCIAQYQKTEDYLNLLKTLLSLNEKELLQANTYTSTFEDGSSFIDDQHDFAGDLDVFGPSSLYQYINRTGTLSGREQLAASLRKPLTGVKEIEQTQQVVQELSGKIDFRQLLTAQAILSDERKEDKTSILYWLHLPMVFLQNKILYALIWISPLCLFLSIIFFLFTANFIPAFIFLVVNWILLLGNIGKINAQHQWMSNKEKILNKFSLLLKLIREESFGEVPLLKQQQEIADEAGHAMHRLGRISNALDQRVNVLVAIFLNSLLLHDLHTIYNLEKWKARYQEKVQGWFDVIARMEVWNSLATFAFNHSQYTYPVMQQQPTMLVATGLGHPLIPEAQCVKNDATIGKDAQFLIITGSNMSGKSTFQRSVGTNMLLAMCGAPVCATTFICSPMRMMTSMRIKDSIAKHTSYFQAELLRLQHIIEVLQTGETVFIILDEILKGTNSEDKLSGSRSLIEHFLQYNCLGMIATHDLELGHLEAAYPRQIKNYCFESTIQDDHLYFDYLIREGVARNKNATFLMKQMEII